MTSDSPEVGLWLDVEDANEIFRTWVGRTCHVWRREFDWAFVFGEGDSVTAGCTWRLIARGRIVLCDGDDGAQFGLPAPVDALTVAREVLDDRTVATVTAAEVTSDLEVTFDGGVVLQLLSNSSGYEAWNATLATPTGSTATVVAVGGGGARDPQIRLVWLTSSGDIPEHWPTPAR